MNELIIKDFTDLLLSNLPISIKDSFGKILCSCCVHNVDLSPYYYYKINKIDILHQKKHLLISIEIEI